MNGNIPRRYFWAICSQSYLIASTTTWAQSTFGSVVGTVADSSGSPIPGTEVVLTNLGTSAKRTQPTNGEDCTSS